VLASIKTSKLYPSKASFDWESLQLSVENSQAVKRPIRPIVKIKQMNKKKD
jgi:hypothetical protein